MSPAKGSKAASDEHAAEHSRFLPNNHYQNLQVSEEPRHWLRKHACQRVVVVSLGSVLLLALLAQIASISLSHSINVTTLEQAHEILPHPRDNGTCGGSTEEARKAGCVFDRVEFSWLPADCIGDDVDDYLAISDWRYYDDNRTEVPTDVAWKGEHLYLWITWRQHLTHCTYMWKRLHRAVLLRQQTDSYIADYEHTTHCSEMLLKEDFSPDDINVQLFVKFPTCGIRLDRQDLGSPWPSVGSV